ncbi:MAG: efflux RND transporter periplasmic adaptor subunit [Verrucomicrobiota bacterium]
MKKLQFVLITLILALGGAAAWRILQKPAGQAADPHGHGSPAAGRDEHGHSHGEDEPHAHAGPAKTVPEDGPHGGKLLRGAGFEIEVTIFEDGVPPEFRLYGYRNGQPLPPAELKAGIELQRLDRKDTFAFQPREDYLLGTGVVKEPHSFDVVVRAEHAGKKAEWTYESYEGRATIAPEYARAAGIAVAQAGPATIRETLTLHGIVLADANRVARVGARFPGIVKAVHRQLGDTVAAGDLLAVVESNESLQAYEVRAPQAGLVTERAASAGAVTGEAPLFVITDLSAVWVDISVFPSDAPKLRAGLPVTVRSLDDGTATETVLAPFLPATTGASQTRVIRVTLDNRDGRWTPGQRVHAVVQLPPHEAPLAVRTTGLQSFRDFTVVFAQVGDTYEVRMLELGRSDGEFIEVLGGLDAGTRYVTANSFLVKADALKSGASHDH